MGSNPPLGTLGNVSENLFLGGRPKLCEVIWVDDRIIEKCLRSEPWLHKMFPKNEYKINDIYVYII